ncbi:DUF6456 domain-containing protein [Afifella pfennigii]|uniref:DUF6456 domain-containing protein n=1 Tax=Afifella pfennigii TaxID=209897 RepID=UPI0009FC874F|nr:DUF6456 domain-containing protein [Afifella pfennigii]
MAGKPRKAPSLAPLLTALAAHPRARLVDVDGHAYRLCHAGRLRLEVPHALARRLLASGLLDQAADGGLCANRQTHAWLKRHGTEDLGFLAQHKVLSRPQTKTEAPTPMLDLDESPIGALARRAGPDGNPYLGPALVEASERLRRDFERASLQPRVTANWEASLKARRHPGERGGREELSQAALDARKRFERAMNAVGPELEGVLVDVCCFLKGLERVERERGFPARSGKLVLKLGLMALARHYGLAECAEGPRRASMRHWGAGDYRPRL